MTVVYSAVRATGHASIVHASTDGRTILCNISRRVREELGTDAGVQCKSCLRTLNTFDHITHEATSLPEYAQQAEAEAAERRQELNDASQERKRQQNPDLQKVGYRPENLNPTQLRARIERESENQHAQRVKRAVSDDAQKNAQTLKMAMVELRLIPGIGSALDVNCPTCFTRAGIACSHNGALSMVHPARVDYWASRDKFMSREELRELAEKFINGYRTPQSAPEEPQQRPEGLADAYRELSRQNDAQKAEASSLELVEELRKLENGEAQRVAAHLRKVEALKSRIREAAERESEAIKKLLEEL